MGFEDITEDMGGNPEVEQWLAVQDGMQSYRVWTDDGSMIVYIVNESGEMDTVNDKTHERVVEMILDHAIQW